MNTNDIKKSVEENNYLSATNEKIKMVVEKQIIEEINNGHYKVATSKPVIVSALGAIPKKNSDKVRLILDCSRPAGSALNDFAVNNPFKYQTLQEATDMMRPNAFLAKVDLSCAYRSVKTHSSNHIATGLRWRFSGDSHDTYLVDTRLPFGARRSPEIFNKLTQAVREIMATKGLNGLIAYLDDFLIISDTQEQCKLHLNMLLQVLRSLGFWINYHKVEGPSQKLTFLGITIDTVAMTLELPQEKLMDLKQTLSNMIAKKKTTKRKLQSLAGKLNWATQCIYGGRFHLRRIIDCISKLDRPWHRTRVTVDIKLDCEWWLKFMNVFNGSTPIIDNRKGIPVSIDACPKATGAFFIHDWVYCPFKQNSDEDNLHINFKEVLALEPAAQVWGHLWSNRKVFVHTDNQAAACIINKGTCRNSVVMKALRRIFWLSAVYNFRLRAVYYPGRNNELADAVSRLHESKGLNRLNRLLCNLLPNSSYYIHYPLCFRPNVFDPP